MIRPSIRLYAPIGVQMYAPGWACGFTTLDHGGLKRVPNSDEREIDLHSAFWYKPNSARNARNSEYNRNRG